MDFKDYYKVMGVNRDSTSDEIKRAYKKLARKYHPDVNKATDAEVRFKEVGEAYAVLKDPEKRASYDQLGNDWQSGQDFNPPPDWDAGFEFKEGAEQVRQILVISLIHYLVTDIAHINETINIKLIIKHVVKITMLKW